jgi:gas vesicle protein
MSRTRRLGSYLLTVCLGEKFPVWATLVGILLGGVITGFGTYLIVPTINESLERQKIRSEFVIRNLDDLNSRTRSLVSDVSDIHNKVLSTNIVDFAALQKTTAKIAEMQWKAIELAVIFEGTTGAPVVEAYQRSLEGVRVALDGLKSKEDLQTTQNAVETLSRSTLDVIRELAALAGLKVKPTLPRT